ncbi:MAG: bifunctional glutamate N-acetyltransferase/amino-acid acetyltransferase ArgJ [Planctomycetota bacterium]
MKRPKDKIVIEEIPGGVMAAAGFRTASLHCGIKRKKPDIAMLVAERRVPVAGIFTTNRIVAAPVVWSRRVARSGWARGVIVNSGNANACTGKTGEADTREMAALAAKVLDARPADMFVASTGVIGRLLPMTKIRKGIRALPEKLATGPRAATDFARGIATTDAFLKEFAVRVRVGKRVFHVGGAAKGAGMISPKMATLLAFLTTDAAVPPPILKRLLARTAETSFNAITVDGHMSTNDSLILLASGGSGVSVGKDALLRKALLEGIKRVSIHLAKEVVRDGEGATRLLTVRITGARTKAAAAAIARAIANSPLVKTAIYGGDPNWGRFLSAVGYAGVPFSPSKLRLILGKTLIFAGGEPRRLSSETIRRIFAEEEIDLTVEMNDGRHDVTVWTCDLTPEYVHLNSAYTT